MDEILKVPILSLFLEEQQMQVHYHERFLIHYSVLIIQQSLPG